MAQPIPPGLGLLIFLILTVAKIRFIIAYPTSWSGQVAANMVLESPWSSSRSASSSSPLRLSPRSAPLYPTSGNTQQQHATHKILILFFSMQQQHATRNMQHMQHTTAQNLQTNCTAQDTQVYLSDMIVRPLHRVCLSCRRATVSAKCFITCILKNRKAHISFRMSATPQVHVNSGFCSWASDSCEPHEGQSWSGLLQGLSLLPAQ